MPRKRASTSIEDTHWKSRLFTVQPVPGFSVAFWEHQEPARGKPIALEGDLSAHEMSFAIVVARWNAVITDRLLQGALDCLLRSGGHREHIEVVRVPGSWEIPAAARKLAETHRFDGIITLGCLIRGETAHYEAIYNEVARGIGQSQQDTGVPHAFGVLTCETLEQALDRAGLKSGNKGFEAASAAIEMASLHRKIGATGGAASMTLVGKRRKSRELAMQMLFQGGCGPAESGRSSQNLLAGARRSRRKPRAASLRICFASRRRGRAEIDAILEQHSKNWRINRMSAVDRNLLRMAVAELVGFPGTPAPIVIDEALEIARRYSAPESIDFLNGVLDTIARSRT